MISSQAVSYNSHHLFVININQKITWEKKCYLACGIILLSLPKGKCTTSSLQTGYENHVDATCNEVQSLTRVLINIVKVRALGCS